jgi:alanine dehydrogenase
MPTLYLTESDVARLVDMPAVLDVVETAFHKLGLGEVSNVPRHRATAEGVVLHTMSAAVDYLGYCGWKSYTTTRSGARFLVGLYENATGELVALIEADGLGQLRTGAVTGVAAKHLAAKGAKRAGLIGTGTQARTQLAAVVTACKLKEASVYSRDPERRASFASWLSDELQIAVKAVDTPAQAVRDMPIVVTATTSREPVFAGDDLSPGTLVCAAGSNWLNKSEIDVRTVRRASRVVCDDIAACKHEAGDLQPALREGVFDWQQAVSLGDVIAGKADGRRTADEIILFKSVGLAMEDIALGAEVLRRAKEAGIGTHLPF